MEKLTFKNSRDLSLVGNLYSSDSNSIVIMAHGFTNNKSFQGRFDRIAESLNELDFDVFAFDFSGCGESDPDILSAAKEVDDLNSAIEFVKSKGYEKIALFGNSLGSLICLRCFRSEIKTMILMGALSHSMTYDWNEEFTQVQMDELERVGIITFNSEELGIRRVDHQMLNDFEDINQKKLLEAITCPVLIIHGNNEEDKEELQLLANSRKGMGLLPETSELVVIEGAKHGCREHIDQVIEVTTKWCLKHMKE
ncbi:alpha/beta hydrolase [Clostridiaceae bacterium HSG29]|nr:alpha/beta hydrolase [Clostridiaceae bacterium HSG29]